MPFARRQNPAGDIFEEAFQQFQSALTKDESKIKWIKDSNHVNLTEVLESVSATRVNYETKKGDSEIRKVLGRVSESVSFYGGVMDVLVQHHPEYTSLAWGAMKFLFVVS